LTFNKKYQMSVVYPRKLCALRPVYNDAMVCAFNMIDVINGENVIYACGHPSRRTRAKPACSSG